MTGRDDGERYGNAEPAHHSWRPQRQEKAPRNKTRRERAADRRRAARPAPGGFTTGCGCRYTRTGGQWIQVRPCTAACNRPFPLPDEHMKTLMQPSTF